MPLGNQASSLENLLNIVQRGQSLKGREIVHVKMEDFVADLLQHGVVQLEETQLRAALAGGVVFSCREAGRIVRMVALQLRQYGFRSLNYGRRHTC